MVLLDWRQRLASLSLHRPLLRRQTMPNSLRKTRKPSPFIVYLLIFLLCLLLFLPWVIAEERPKPKLQPWQINGIMAALDDGHSKVKEYALDALTADELKSLGKKQEEIAQKAAKILKDDKIEDSARRSAARALSNLGASGAKYAPDLVKILKDDKVDAYVRGSAASALSNLGASGAKYAPDILNFLNDEKVDPSVRRDAASALSNLGASGAKYAPDILNFLNDEKVSPNVRGDAASALGNLGASGAKYVPDLVKILKDEKVSPNVRGDAASALGNLGASGAKYAPDLLKILKDEKVNPYVRRFAASALVNMRKLTLKKVVVILSYVYEPNQSIFSLPTSSSQIVFEYWRFLTYFLGGGTDEVKTLLTWLGYPAPATNPTQIKYEDGKKTLELFLRIWNSSQGLNRLQQDLAQQIAIVADQVRWRANDIDLLQKHYKNLKKSGYRQADTIQRLIDNLEFWKWFFLFQKILLIHLAIWLSFILAYPKIPQVLGIFFWNSWLRRILGFGYIGLLLSWVPVLRRKLFEPFQDYLLADAGLSNFNHQTYFPESLVKIPPRTAPLIPTPPNMVSAGEILPEIQPITAALPTVKGQIILEGDSGLGKTMFLRHLVKNSQRIVVYLPAHKCDKGIVEAIQAKLHGQAQDAKFLKNLICNGAIDICIDGLNEVTADTRAKISHFVECYFQGNIIMSTQPLEWIPPSTAKKYELQPLEQEQILRFLISRQPQPDVEYQQACDRYLAEAFNEQQSPEDLAAAKRILSNPMDLTLVALMLCQNKQPDLFHLQEQQYQLMAAEYLREWNHEFPLKRFSDLVYQMRRNDKTAIPSEEFAQELTSMADEKYKMVISRQWENQEGEPQKSWYFRHDKIMEFFLVQNFLGESEEIQARIHEHIDDPRFRGVYILLANLLPLDAALELREKLIEYAAHTKDHTLTDIYVQLVKLRSPQWSQDGTFKQLLRQHEQKEKSLNWAIKFLELVDAQVKRNNSHSLTPSLIIETIEGRLSTYTPLPVLVIDAPTDRDVVRLMESHANLWDSPEKVGMLFFDILTDLEGR